MAAEIIMIAQMPTVANRLILFMFDSSRFFRLIENVFNMSLLFRLCRILHNQNSRLHTKSQQKYRFIDDFSVVTKFHNEVLFKL